MLFLYIAVGFLAVAVCLNTFTIKSLKVTVKSQSREIHALKQDLAMWINYCTELERHIQWLYRSNRMTRHILRNAKLTKQYYEAKEPPLKLIQ